MTLLEVAIFHMHSFFALWLSCSYKPGQKNTFFTAEEMGFLPTVELIKCDGGGSHA